MRTIHDYQGLAIRLTDERLAHILEHPEMIEMESALSKRSLIYSKLWNR